MVIIQKDITGKIEDCYARDVLSMGLFSEIQFERVVATLLEVHAITLHQHGRRNYAIEALTSMTYQLPPRQLLYSLIMKPCNVAADIHMEHLNAVAKGCIKGLGANKTKGAIRRFRAI